MNLYITNAALTITTERLILRPLLPDDASSILQIRSNAIVNKYIKRATASTLKDAVDILTRIEGLRKKNECFYWGIILKETNKLIGTTCYFNFEPIKQQAEIGYELHPDYHKMGIMKEAVKAILHFGFTKIDLKIIVAVCHPQNIGSISLLIKNNFLMDDTYQYVTKTIAEDFKVYYLSKKAPQKN